MKYLWLMALFLNACAVKVEVSSSQIAQLSQKLHLIGIHQKEALKLSKDIFYKSKQLAIEFDLVSPPLWHNFLVNTRLRQKGLCYHWSDSLFFYLKSKNYQEASFHLIGANIGSYWTEHNAMMISVKGLKMNESIIIDPWRNSGTLFFSQIKEDKNYQWKKRFYREKFIYSNPK